MFCFSRASRRLCSCTVLAVAARSTATISGGVPKNTPPEVVAVLRTATAQIVQEPSLREALEKQNMGYAYADGPAFAAVMAKDHAFYRGLIQKLGLKGQ